MALSLLWFLYWGINNNLGNPQWFIYPKRALPDFHIGKLISWLHGVTVVFVGIWNKHTVLSINHVFFHVPLRNIWLHRGATKWSVGWRLGIHKDRGYRCWPQQYGLQQHHNSMWSWREDLYIWDPGFIIKMCDLSGFPKERRGKKRMHRILNLVSQYSRWLVNQILYPWYSDNPQNIPRLFQDVNNVEN